MVESIIERKKIEDAQERFAKSQIIILGQRGVYQIDDIEYIEFGPSTERCYLLSKVFSKSIHKTFVPIKNIKKDQMREISSLETINSLETLLFEHGFELIDTKWNSVKKIDYYNKIILKDGFIGLVKSYVAAAVDLNQTLREEKKFRMYSEKLKRAIIEEMSYVTNQTFEDCDKKLKRYVSMFASL